MTRDETSTNMEMDDADHQDGREIRAIEADVDSACLLHLAGENKKPLSIYSCGNPIANYPSRSWRT